MSNFRGATSLIGGGFGALDTIDGTTLQDGDAALVITDDKSYILRLDEDNAGAENSPLIISPDVNAGNKRWVLNDLVCAGLTVRPITDNIDAFAILDANTELGVFRVDTLNHRVGINCYPATRFHIAADAGIMPPNISSVIAAFAANSESGDDARIAIIGGTNSGSCSFWFGDKDEARAGFLSYVNRTTATIEYMAFGVNTAEKMRLWANGSLNIGGSSLPPYRLSVTSSDGTKQAGFYHDNAGARIKWTGIGGLSISTDEGDDTNTIVSILGKGYGYGQLKILDNYNRQYLKLSANVEAGAEIRLAGTHLKYLRFQSLGDAPVAFFRDSPENVTQEFKVYGNLAVTKKAKIGNDIDYTEFVKNRNIIRHGDARTLNALTIDAEGMKAPGIKPAVKVDWGIGSAWEFTDGTDDTVVLKIRIPHRMDHTVQPSILHHWSGITADPGDGSIKTCWQIEALFRADGEAMDAAAEETLVCYNCVTSIVSKGLAHSVFQLSTFERNDHLLLLRIKRLGAEAADTQDGENAYLHSIDFQFIRNKDGDPLVSLIGSITGISEVSAEDFESPPSNP